jgi:hypothetical protein
MPELERIACPRELVLLDADRPLDHIFFPDSGVISVVAVYADGSIIEMANDRKGGLRAGVSGPWRQNLLGPAPRADPRQCGKNLARGFHPGHGIHAALPKSHDLLRPGFP